MEPRARLQFDARIRLPSHALFIGATQSGKTRLCLHLLTRPELFEPKPTQILFHYDQFQDSYLEAKETLERDHNIQLKLFKGCDGINLDDIEATEGQTILLIDDFSEETSSSKEIARIATNGRHKNMACVALSLCQARSFTKDLSKRPLVLLPAFATARIPTANLW